MAKRESMRSENPFIDRDTINLLAQTITDRLKSVLSDPRYAAQGKSLSMRWLASFQFEADARVEENGDHQIAISYGALYEIYRDAIVLPQVCVRTLTDPFYDPIYELLYYGNDRKDVLPADLDTQTARTEGMMAGISWLYCHEQAHLFEAHGDVAKAVGAGVLDESGAVAEVEGSEPLIGRDAAVRHVFELCADHEATFIALKEMTKFGAPIKQSDLWLFVVTLCCMFQRLSGPIDQPLSGKAIGTHPHPAFRMRMAVRQIKVYLDDPLVKTQMGVQLNPEAVDRLLDHAVTTATIYWHIRYRDENTLPAFMLHVQDPDPVPATYREQLYEIWMLLEPEIAARYLGWGGGRYRLQLSGPDDLA